jgi:hypothetical protein
MFTAGNAAQRVTDGRNKVATGSFGHVSVLVAAQPPSYCAVANAEFFGDLSKAGSPRLQAMDFFMIYDPARMAKLFTGRPCIPNACAHPLPDRVTLQLSDERHNCEECPPQRDWKLSCEV